MSISVDIQNDVALITLDDGKANAVNFELMEALNAALDKAEADAKAIVLAGREGRFSGGFDLGMMGSFTREDSVRLLDRASELVLRLYGGPLPIVGACTGHAIAMGVFLLMSCDTRVGAAGDFKLGANESITGMTLPVFAVELARDRPRPSARPARGRALTRRRDRPLLRQPLAGLLREPRLPARFAAAVRKAAG